jgi:KDO2-lipid IV(A) lauroyltransferase
MSVERKPLSSFWGPKYWPTWFGMGLLRLVCLLPHRVALMLGRVFGRIAYRIGGSRLAIVRRNIELCFPDLTEKERQDLITKHFDALGMLIIEVGLGRWASDKHLASITTIIGLEHVQAAVEKGQGIILLAAHFTTMEISGRVLALNIPPYDGVYRENSSDFINELQRTSRERSSDNTIEKRDIKKMVRSLRAGRPVWYGPDQSYNRKGAEVVDFFGVPSSQTTATSTLARLGKAAVIPFFPRRLENGRYEMVLLPAFDNFPSDDPVADTRRYNAVLEEHIRTCPEQYFWIHRKFKDLPDGYPDLYADL